MGELVKQGKSPLSRGPARSKIVVVRAFRGRPQENGPYRAWSDHSFNAWSLFFREMFNLTH